MIKLENISKYYSRNGNVALGLRKINLNLFSGEFIAIVGESGSGKSTLLNVISGIDSYEEGELWINDEQTSHYTVEDWEHYRKNYVGFVFQNYNIIDSYTVLQNVEAALILSQYDKTKRRNRALEIIERVGLLSFKDTKASKLSGGQMQRTVIARALAKDCPIIACDEPTGNLDSKSSKQVIDLLHEISKEKLVLIVTHNYQEIEHLATRKITLHDGNLVEDRKLKPGKLKELPVFSEKTKKVSFIDTLMMAIRNVSATPIKSFIMFMVLLILTLGSSLVYGSMLNFKDDNATRNQNIYFTNSMKERIILRKQDKTAFTTQEITNLSNKPYVKKIITSDVALDQQLSVYYPNHHIYASKLTSWALINKHDLSYGRLPKSPDEVVINSSVLRDGADVLQILNHTFMYLFNQNAYSLKVVGISENKKMGEFIYLSDDMLKTINTDAMANYKNFSYSLDELNQISFSPLVIDEKNQDIHLNDNEIAINQSLASSYIKINHLANINDVIGLPFTITSSSLYETSTNTFTIGAVIDDGSPNDNISMTNTTYHQLLEEKGIYQISILTDSYTHSQNLVKQLDIGTYKVFYPFGTLSPTSYLIEVVKVIGYAAYLIFFIGIFFFITYFILRNVMVSKRNDYIILRSIGATKHLIRNLVFYELLMISSLTYLTTLLLLFLSHHINVKYITDAILKLFHYYSFVDYVYIYLILIIIIIFLTRRFNKKLFSGSVMMTFKAEGE